MTTSITTIMRASNPTIYLWLHRTLPCPHICCSEKNSAGAIFKASAAKKVMHFLLFGMTQNRLFLHNVLAKINNIILSVIIRMVSAKFGN
jgi:hypothetical protein